MAAKQPIVDRLHVELHTLPGMPAHEDAARLNSIAHSSRVHKANRSAPHPSPNSPTHASRTAHHNDPKVLIAWQRFIGGLFHRNAN
jgi:hypothetical protein